MHRSLNTRRHSTPKRKQSHKTQPSKLHKKTLTTIARASPSDNTTPQSSTTLTPTPQSQSSYHTTSTNNVLNDQNNDYNTSSPILTTLSPRSHMKHSTIHRTTRRHFRSKSSIPSVRRKSLLVNRPIEDNSSIDTSSSITSPSSTLGSSTNTKTTTKRRHFSTTQSPVVNQHHHAQFVMPFNRRVAEAHLQKENDAIYARDIPESLDTYSAISALDRMGILHLSMSSLDQAVPHLVEFSTAAVLIKENIKNVILNKFVNTKGQVYHIESPLLTHPRSLSTYPIKTAHMQIYATCNDCFTDVSIDDLVKSLSLQSYMPTFADASFSYQRWVQSVNDFYTSSCQPQASCNCCGSKSLSKLKTFDPTLSFHAIRRLKSFYTEGNAESTNRSYIQDGSAESLSRGVEFADSSEHAAAIKRPQNATPSFAPSAQGEIDDDGMDEFDPNDLDGYYGSKTNNRNNNNHQRRQNNNNNNNNNNPQQIVEDLEYDPSNTQSLFPVAEGRRHGTYLKYTTLPTALESLTDPIKFNKATLPFSFFQHTKTFSTPRQTTRIALPTTITPAGRQTQVGLKVSRYENDILSLTTFVDGSQVKANIEIQSTQFANVLTTALGLRFGHKKSTLAQINAAQSNDRATVIQESDGEEDEDGFMQPSTPTSSLPASLQRPKTFLSNFITTPVTPDQSQPSKNVILLPPTKTKGFKLVDTTPVVRTSPFSPSYSIDFLYNAAGFRRSLMGMQAFTHELYSSYHGDEKQPLCFIPPPQAQPPTQRPNLNQSNQLPPKRPPPQQSITTQRKKQQHDESSTEDELYDPSETKHSPTHTTNTTPTPPQTTQTTQITQTATTTDNHIVHENEEDEQGNKKKPTLFQLTRQNLKSFSSLTSKIPLLDRTLQTTPTETTKPKQQRKELDSLIDADDLGDTSSEDEKKTTIHPYLPKSITSSNLTKKPSPDDDLFDAEDADTADEETENDEYPHAANNHNVSLLNNAGTVVRPQPGSSRSSYSNGPVNPFTARQQQTNKKNQTGNNPSTNANNSATTTITPAQTIPPPPPQPTNSRFLVLPSTIHTQINLDDLLITTLHAHVKSQTYMRRQGNNTVPVSRYYLDLPPALEPYHISFISTDYFPDDLTSASTAFYNTLSQFKKIFWQPPHPKSHQHYSTADAMGIPYTVKLYPQGRICQIRYRNTMKSILMDQDELLKRLAFGEPLH